MSFLRVPNFVLALKENQKELHFGDPLTKRHTQMLHVGDKGNPATINVQISLTGPSFLSRQSWTYSRLEQMRSQYDEAREPARWP